MAKQASRGKRDYTQAPNRQCTAAMVAEGTYPTGEQTDMGSLACCDVAKA
jgi:hypothetical protein